MAGVLGNSALSSLRSANLDVGPVWQPVALLKLCSLLGHVGEAMETGLMSLPRCAWGPLDATCQPEHVTPRAHS